MKKIVALVILALSLAVPHPAGAIVYGEPDDGRHPNVGAVVGAIQDPTTGQTILQPICTGTLVDEDVVVSAAHCFALLPFEVEAFYFTLAPVVDADRDRIVDPGVPLLRGEPVTHPRFGVRSQSNPYDLAVLLLERRVTEVTPAPLPELGLLDDRSVRDETFVTVGYGAVRDTRKKAYQSLRPGGQRMMAEQTFLSRTRAWVNFSMNQATGNGGTCYGDSGGPHFLGDVLVSVTVTGDAVCKALDTTYRLDTPWSLAFLSRHVGTS